MNENNPAPLKPTETNRTSYISADFSHSTRVVVMPVSDDDLLDAGTELSQGVFKVADVLWNRRFSCVNEHTSEIKIKTETEHNLYSCDQPSQNITQKKRIRKQIWTIKWVFCSDLFNEGKEVKLNLPHNEWYISFELWGNGTVVLGE